MGFCRSYLQSCCIAVMTLTLLTSCDGMPVKRHDSSEDFIKIGDLGLITTNNHATLRERRNAVFDSDASHGALWPGAVIPYTISPEYNEAERRILFQAMKHWEDCTCIRFRPKTDSDVFAINYQGANIGICASFFGRIAEVDQPQPVIFSPLCLFFAVVVHEIGHAIGFYHEHQRYDRDEFIEVFVDNLISIPGLEGQYTKLAEGEADTLGFGYDYASVMHYKADLFALPGTNVMVSRQPGIPLGGDQLSPLDIAKANNLYNCGPQDTHPPPSTVVPDAPAITLPPGVTCGSVVEVTGDGTFTFPTLTSTGSPQTCALVLRAPEGYEYVISFPNFPLSLSTDCNDEFVQIFRGSSTSPNDLITNFGGTEVAQGRLCDSNFITTFSFTGTLNTIFVQTNDTVNGLTVSYAIQDINECDTPRTTNCHTCTNTDGSFECGCNIGYYLSTAFEFSTCFDVNECAVNNGDCEQTCTNLGGGYRCSCEDDLFLQSDGLSCGHCMPASSPPTPSPGTVIPKLLTAIDEDEDSEDSNSEDSSDIDCEESSESSDSSESSNSK